MNPVLQPSPQPQAPQSSPAQPTTIDVVSAPAQSIPVRQVNGTNPFSMAPAQPQPATSFNPPSVIAEPKPQAPKVADVPVSHKRGLKHFWPAVAAVMAAIILATAAVYAFKTVNKPSTDQPASQAQVAVKPITSSDLDQLSKSFGDLTNLNDVQDFSAESLSNQAFGF